MRLFAVMMLALVAFSSFGQAEKSKQDSSKLESSGSHAVNPGPAKVETDELPSLKLTPLQLQDISNHQLRVKEFQLRVEAETNALGREYRSMIHTIIHANNIADYSEYIVEADRIRVLVPKKKKP